MSMATEIMDVEAPQCTKEITRKVNSELPKKKAKKVKIEKSDVVVAKLASKKKETSQWKECQRKLLLRRKLFSNHLKIRGPKGLQGAICGI